MLMKHSFITWTLFLQVNLYIFIYSERYGSRWFLRVGINSKLLWFKFEKCLNAEKLLPCYFYQGWSTDPHDLSPTGLDSAFPDLSSKIGFIQFGALNRSGLIFEVGYRSEFETKWKMFNSNNSATQEKLTGRPAKRSAPTGCLSGCPHSSVTRG